MAREYWRWIDGQYTISPVISDTAGGFQHGYGAFETIYFKEGQVYHLSKHLKRLQGAAKFYHLSFHLTEAELQKVILNLTEKNALQEARIKLCLTAATADYSDSPIPSQLIITALPYTRNHQNASLVTAPAQQFGCPLSRYKSTSYASYILARLHATHLEATDTLMHDQSGNYIECSTSNIFFAKDGEWFTPNLTHYGLEGIQRGMVLGAMKKLNIPCSVEPVTHLNYDFAFITNSLRGVQVIERIDQTSYGTSQKRYRDQLEALTAQIALM